MPQELNWVTPWFSPESYDDSLAREMVLNPGIRKIKHDFETKEALNHLLSNLVMPSEPPGLIWIPKHLVGVADEWPIGMGLVSKLKVVDERTDFFGCDWVFPFTDTAEINPEFQSCENIQLNLYELTHGGGRRWKETVTKEADEQLNVRWLVNLVAGDIEPEWHKLELVRFTPAEITAIPA